MTVSIGERIGSYRVVRPLGTGGYGLVVEAVHVQIGTPAAIKLLRRDILQTDGLIRRFLNEARVASLVKHPGIVRAFEFDRLPDGTPYIIMELLEGTTLRQLLAGSLSLSDALRFVRQAADTLAAAHEQGIVHRDLKPSNLIVVPDPEAPGGSRIKILDFGIAKFLQEDQEEAPSPQGTRTDARFGTPAYMSPEQCRSARRVDGASDVYSLGVVLYQLLCGRLPFDGDEGGAVMAMHIYEDPRPLREVRPALPAGLVGLVEAMMAKQAPRRPTMRAVVTTLEQFGSVSGDAGTGPGPAVAVSAGDTSQDGPPLPPRARPAKGLWVGLLLAAAVAAGLVLRTQAWFVRGPERVQTKDPAGAAPARPAVPPPVLSPGPGPLEIPAMANLAVPDLSPGRPAMGAAAPDMGPGRPVKKQSAATPRHRLKVEPIWRDEDDDLPP